MDLLAGFELFTQTGTALPEATIEYVVYKFWCQEEGPDIRIDRVHHRALREQDCALFGAVRLVLYPRRLSGTFVFLADGMIADSNASPGGQIQLRLSEERTARSAPIGV